MYTIFLPITDAYLQLYNCAFYCNDQALCCHILFKRNNENLPVFYPSLFHDWYLRENAIHSQVEFWGTEAFLQGFEEDCAEKNGSTDALDVRQWYNWYRSIIWSFSLPCKLHHSLPLTALVNSTSTWIH